jgi:hypothetical protein
MNKKKALHNDRIVQVPRHKLAWFTPPFLFHPVYLKLNQAHESVKDPEKMA